MKNATYILACVFSGLLLAGCAGQNSDQPLSERPIRVVATTTMLADAVRIVGGERVAVHGLMGPGIDPHQYEASAGDVTRMERADLVIYNGSHLEGKMEEVFAKMHGRTKTVAATEAIPAAELRSVPDFEGGHDPHIWFDVLLWKKVIEHIRDKLAELDPAHAETYRSHGAKYLAELDALHRHVKEQSDRVPAGQRVLITAHDAFGYFARAYGFEVRGLQGVSTQSEASIADVRELADFIVERRIPAIFVESSVPPKNIKAVQEAVEARGYRVDIGGELFSDSLGNLQEPAGSYAGMMRHNLDTIVKALTRDQATR